MESKKRVLLTGATGFVGTHVYPKLVEAGFEVICATRKPEQARAEHPDRSFRYFDLEDRGSVVNALREVSAAVYLVHSMAEGGSYARKEEDNAGRFRSAAEEVGLERIVYLGGMRPSGVPSRHLASRLATGRILREPHLSIPGGRREERVDAKAPVNTIELQATMVIGGGSESFRIVRDLAARLPLMLLPRWLSSVSEPVAIRDIAAAIVQALSIPLTESRVYTVPGPEKMSGKEIILRTARLLGNKPRTLSVPLVSPGLSSFWIRLVTRTNPAIASQLVQGLLTDIVSEGPQIWDTMPGYRRTPFDEAARAALAEEDAGLSLASRVVEGVITPLTRERADAQNHELHDDRQSHPHERHSVSA